MVSIAAVSVLAPWPYSRNQRAGSIVSLAAVTVLALHRARRVTVYLTCVGGGAFGNDEEWILDAIELAVAKVAGLPL